MGGSIKATKNTVVAIDYTLTDASGSLIDSSDEGSPLEYLHGTGYILPKLEAAIEGKSVGDAFSIDLSPEDGYGVYDESLVVDIPIEQFETFGTITEGMQFQGETPLGPRIVTVTHVGEKLITVDANHRLAGKALHFDVRIADVREASEAEMLRGFAGARDCSCGESGCGGCGGGCSSSCGGGCYGGTDDEYEEEDGCSFCSCGCCG